MDYNCKDEKGEKASGGKGEDGKKKENEQRFWAGWARN